MEELHLLVLFLLTYFPVIAINEGATDCINEKVIGAINEAAISAIIAPINPPFCFFYFMFYCFSSTIHQLIDLIFLMTLLF